MSDQQQEEVDPNQYEPGQASEDYEVGGEQDDT